MGEYTVRRTPPRRVPLMFADLRARLRGMIAATPAAARHAAPLVQAQARRDLTTALGNVPWFKGPLKGSTDIPFTVKAVGTNLEMRGVGWAMKRAYDRNYVAGWSAIVRQAARDAMKGKR